jgi:hypothetical protein
MHSIFDARSGILPMFSGAPELWGGRHCSAFCTVALCRSCLSLEYREYEPGRHSDGGKSHCICRGTNTGYPVYSLDTQLINVYIFMARQPLVDRNSSLSKLHDHKENSNSHYTTCTTHGHSCVRRDSNRHSQQAKGPDLLLTQRSHRDRCDWCTLANKNRLQIIITISQRFQF